MIFVMIKLDELKVFIAVAEAGSFVAAANRLDIAPPVVSRSIKNLENRLQTTLFSRTTRKILITSEGQWLLTQATKTVENLDQIYHHFRNGEVEPEGVLTVDAATPFILHGIAPIISEFVERYPKIEINLQSNEAISDLIEDKVDVAIRMGNLKDSSLKAKKIGFVNRGLYASPRYLEQNGELTCVDDLNLHSCLGFSHPKNLNTWPLKTKTGEWVSIKPSMSANSGEALKMLAVFDNGIVCLSKFTVIGELERGELTPVLKEQTEYHPTPIYAVYYSEGASVRSIRLFLKFLEEHNVFNCHNSFHNL
ncbi:LysR substrate-binding domain-containing protein [Kiloniella antarctica]|uniref:LysR substrate-binding domain-containing protein n=1 Tax=Kiloniella antarctica TaxID=1550907 RepID=A0ABW5BJS8_9PROT